MIILMKEKGAPTPLTPHPDCPDLHPGESNRIGAIQPGVLPPARVSNPELPGAIPVETPGSPGDSAGIGHCNAPGSRG